jgi:ATP-binding cassette, subfamily F, member 3
MLNFTNISLRRGSRLLFAEMSFTLHKGQKVGVTGANGTGKSSLFAMIRNQLHADAGEFSMPPDLVVAHVAQETPAVMQQAIEYVIDGDRELRALQKQLWKAEQENNGVQQAELHARLDDIDGYTALSRASRLMSGLGFLSNQQNLPVSEFSGGWRMRLNLAQALMCRSDVLLLDEPTNHLDLDAVLWLQDWLEKYPGTLLLISHDRDFLDAIVDRILHIERNKAELYTGNYSAFERLRAEKLAQQQSAYEKQQKEILHMQSFVDRFRAKATKAKQAQSRIKSLQRMTLIAQAHVDSPFNFNFPEPEKLPNPLLRLEDVHLGYGQTEILGQIQLSIAPGDRIGLLGPNGAGKSSLIKLLAGHLSPLQGSRDVADALQIGYFAQHQLEQLHVEENPLWHLQRIAPKATEKELRNFLGGFDFRGDKVLDPVAPFSGGEKARLVLALLVYLGPNLLLLDEPTNHLDLEMRHALSVALQDYQGAIVVVSHDRHLLSSVTDQLLLVAHGKMIPFDGDLDEYRKWLVEQRNELSLATSEEANNFISKKQQRRLDAEKRQQLKPLRNALKKAEEAVAKLHNDQHRLEEQLAAPEIYADAEKNHLRTLLQKKTEIDKALDAAEAEWLSTSEKLEQLEN